MCISVGIIIIAFTIVQYKSRSAMLYIAGLLDFIDLFYM